MQRIKDNNCSLPSTIIISSNQDNVPNIKKIAYAVPAFALAVIGIPIYMHIPKFYTDVVGVNLTILGYLTFGVRIFDAVTDPILGFLSDRTETRFGRRRPYITIGAVFLALIIYLLFNPPESSSTQFNTWWFGINIYLLFLFLTIVAVPYESLGPEITFDYDERIALFGLRDGLFLVGTVIAAIIPIIIVKVLSLSTDVIGERTKFFWTSIIYVFLLLICCLWCVFAIQERSQISIGKRQNFLQGLTSVFSNKPFVILLIAFTISSFGFNLTPALMLYYVQYVLHSNRATIFIALYFATGILFLPGWLALSHRLGKKETWLLSMAINAGAFVWVFFLGAGDELWYGICVFFSGIGFGATAALVSALEADVIDYDELLSGKRREGRYLGIWAIIKKFSGALGIGIALPLLGMSGYVPNVEQTPKVLLLLRIFYVIIPVSCNFLAILVTLAYPINRNVHKQILEAIAERRSGRTIVNPLNPKHVIS